MQGVSLLVRVFPSLVLLSALAVGCLHRASAEEYPLSTIAPDQRAKFAEQVRAMRMAMLDRGTVPAPTLSFEAQTREEAGVRVTVAPLLAERMPWNAWPDGTARLFNDSVGYVWSVRVEADRAVQWNPSRTTLAVNDTEQVFAVAAVPDEVLRVLLLGAAHEASLGAHPDLTLRVRAADEFRRAYLPQQLGPGVSEGVLVFPAPTRNIHAVAMQIEVALVLRDEGMRKFRFLFE